MLSGEKTALERSSTQRTVSSSASASSSRRHHALAGLGHGPSHRHQARLGVTTEYNDLELHSAAAGANIGESKRASVVDDGRAGLVDDPAPHTHEQAMGQPVNSVKNGILPLHAAASSGSVAVVRELIENGADVNAPRLSRRYSHDRSRSSGMAAGTTGSTALHFAAANGHADIVSLLLEFGADPSAEEKYGLTPEMIATQRGHFEAASLLRQAQLEQADRAAASAASGSVVKSLAKKRIHPQRSFDALAVKLQQHASQPHLPSSLHMTPSSSSLNTQAALAGASVVRRMSAPHNNKDPNAPRRPSLPSVFEKAAHPSATLKHALGMSLKRSADSKSLALKSESRTSLSSTLLGRNRSNSVIQDDEKDLAELDEEFGDQAIDLRKERDELFRPSTTTTTTMQSGSSGPSVVGRRLSIGQTGPGTARADRFYRPRQSSQLSGRTSVAASSPASARVFIDDDDEGTIPKDGQEVPSRTASLRDPDSSRPSTPYLSTSEMSSSRGPADSSDRASTTSQSTFGASQRPSAMEPRLGAAAPRNEAESAPADENEAAESPDFRPTVKAPTLGVDNVKRVETRAHRSDSVGTDGRFSSSAASSYSGPGTLSTYAPSVSTNATSIYPSTQGTAAKSSLSPLYESAAGSVAASSITTSAQARSRVRKAERELLSHNAAPHGTARSSLKQKLAAYGQTLALERNLAAMEMSSPAKQCSPFKYETIGTSAIKPTASSSQSVVTSQPLDSRTVVPQWRAVPTTDRLGPPSALSHGRNRVASPAEADRGTHGRKLSDTRATAIGDRSTNDGSKQTHHDGTGNQLAEPVVFGSNANAPKGPVSYVQARPSTKPDPTVPSVNDVPSGVTNAHDKHNKNGNGNGGTSSRRSDRTHSNKGTSSVTSARDQVELDAIEQSRMEQAVPKAQITASKDKNKGSKKSSGAAQTTMAGTTLSSLLEQSQRLHTSLVSGSGLSDRQHGALSSPNKLAASTMNASTNRPPSDNTTMISSAATAGASSSFDLPAIQLGLDQIEQHSRRIAQRSAKEFKGQQGSAAYLLASGGVNADQLSSTVNAVNLAGTFEPLLPLSDTDVEGYLRHTHEQTIISAIEEGRRQTSLDFYRNLDNSIRRDWDRQKEKLFEELGRHHAISGGGQASPSGGEKPASYDSPRKKGAVGGYDRGSPLVAMPSASSSLQMHSRMMRYDKVVRKLNEFRKEGYAFGLVSSFGEASAALAGDSKTIQTTESWRLLSHIVQERDVLNGEFQRTALQERQYAAAYLAKDQESLDAVQLRQMFGQGSRAYLEEQFMSYVEKTLASRPAEANLGGVPSIQHKIRAFLAVKYQKQGQWTNQNLEIVSDTPVWARIYYLLRAGYTKEALTFATENESQIQKLEKSFVAYFKAWLDSPDRRLPKLLRDRFLSEYNQRIRYLTDTSDPYKHALFKLIGRVEINRRNVPGVTQTTEDWLWFQLSLVRETNGPGEAAHERYGLRDLAKVLVKFGEGHFDPRGTRPVLYFQVLLLCGQFERAIAFLYLHAQYQTDAVHFAIALAYYGLLRIPGKQKSSDVDLLVADHDGSGYEAPRLNFARLIQRYTRAFAHTDTEEALNYLYLVCLNADVPEPIGKEQVSLCHDYIRELVMDTRKYSQLLGDVRNDGTKIPGQIERDLKLVHLKDERSYLLGIVKAAAQRADQEKRFSEAILLYNLAEEYDSVIAVLNAELGVSLSKPSMNAAESTDQAYFSKGETVGLAAGQDDIAKVARSILEHYDRSSGMSGRVSRKNRETCEVLLRLKEAMVSYEQNKLDSALQASAKTIEDINIIPLHGDLPSIIRAADDFKDLDDAIIRNFDTILLTTMNMIYKAHQQLKDSPFGDASRQQATHGRVAAESEVVDYVRRHASFPGELLNTTPSAAALFFPPADGTIARRASEPVHSAYFLSSDATGDSTDLLDKLAHDSSKLQWSETLTVELWRGKVSHDVRSSMLFDVVVERVMPAELSASVPSEQSTIHGCEMASRSASTPPSTSSYSQQQRNGHLAPSVRYEMIVLRPSVIQATDSARAAANAQFQVGSKSTPVLETWTKLSRQALNRLTSTWHEREERPSSMEVYSALKHMTARVTSDRDTEEQFSNDAQGYDVEITQGDSTMSTLPQISDGKLSPIGLAELVDHLPTIVFTSAPDGQVTWLNKAWSEFTGLGPVESLDYQTWQSMFNEEDLVRVIPIWVNAMATGEPFSFEYRVKRRDGQQRWCVCAGRAVKDSDSGKVLNWCCSIVEVEGLVRARAEALRVKEHIRRVLSTADIVLLSVDSDTLVTFFEGNVELARSLGHPGAPSQSTPIIAGQTRLCDLFAGDERLGQAVDQILVGREHSVSLLLSFGNDAQHLMSLEGNSPGSSAGVVIIATDATLGIKTEAEWKESYRMQAELRASETAANEANRLKTEFLSVISHEIRTPIAGVLSICELLQASPDLSQEHRLLVQKAAKCGDNLLELVGMVLDVRKVEAGEFELEEAPIKVADMLEDARLFSLAVSQKHLAFREEVGPCFDGFLLGDRLRIRQILANGLSNAIKFTKSGFVTLRLRQEDSAVEDDRVWLRFEIEDSGEGIHADVLPTLFQPFRQADASTARRFGGSGLGLVISRKFVELMGGEAWLESELGKGTKMIVRMPLRRATSQTCKAVSQESYVSPETTALQHRAIAANRRASITSMPDKVKILLAEDNDVLREILTRTLEKRNFYVRAVEDGASAVAEIHQNRYDLILMDGQMPSMSGLGATRLIRHSSNARVRKVPIIALTASAIEGEKERCLEGGMNDFITKPVRAIDLEAAIWRQLRPGSTD
ncbi:nuclear pore complex subunit [Microbotryomycetes sp. JL201]|nr:nuclear pore complex subunit [Microbotryomycetes sp. JL201]